VAKASGVRTWFRALFSHSMSSRILIADDHAGVRKMLKLLVETQAGWEVCGEAENGREAVAKAAELQPDLIVLDLAMPVMDGIRASREISAAMPGVPILMHTLHYSSALELEAKKVGVKRVVAKTGSGDELVSAMGALLSEGANPVAAVVSAPEVEMTIVDAPAAKAPGDAGESSSSTNDGYENAPKPD
jgi:DNA-binding NarL/FixJ family response regulator